MRKLQYEDLSTNTLSSAIQRKESFEVLGLSGRMSSAVSMVESGIEREGLKCRIYTAGRIAAAGGTLFGGITGTIGLVSTIGIAAHNLATYNPDYEIAKYVVDNRLVVTYKK